MSAVFDHNLPNYEVHNNGVTPYNGITSTVLSYDGHAGYDYVLRYEPVLAAANGRVSEARWYYRRTLPGGPLQHIIKWAVLSCRQKGT